MRNAIIFVGCLLTALFCYSQKPLIELVNGDTVVSNIPIAHFTNALLKFDSLEESQKEVGILLSSIKIRDQHIRNKDATIDDLMGVVQMDNVLITKYEEVQSIDLATIKLKDQKIRGWKIKAGLALIIGLFL